MAMPIQDADGAEVISDDPGDDEKVPKPKDDEMIPASTDAVWGSQSEQASDDPAGALPGYDDFTPEDKKITLSAEPHHSASDDSKSARRASLKREVSESAERLKVLELELARLKSLRGEFQLTRKLLG